MIIGIEGAIGAGKTLVMTYLLKEDYKESQEEKPIYANYTLRTLPFTKVDREFLVNAMRLKMSLEGDSEQGAILALDEIHTLMDSRRSQSQMELLMSYFILQTGKEGINLYYTTQNFRQVEKRLRERTDIAIRVTRKGDNHLCIAVDRTTPEEKVRRFVVPGHLVWDDYYTREIIAPPMPPEKNNGRHASG